VQFEDNKTCDSALEDCGIQRVDQVLNKKLNIKQHSWMHKKDWKQAESTCQFDTKDNITVMCNKVEKNYTD
jgi:hypothetical protein